jgi:transcriptional regulator with XRE-family HTH domain
LTIGEKIKSIREHHGLTQHEFAKMLGVSLSYISKVELDRKNPGRELLKKIAAQFQVSVDYLLGFSEKKEHPAAPVPSQEEWTSFIASDSINPTIRTIIQILVQLDDKRLQHVLSFTSYLLHEQNNHASNPSGPHVTGEEPAP